MLKKRPGGAGDKPVPPEKDEGPREARVPEVRRNGKDGDS